MEKKLKYIFKNEVKNIFFIRHPEVENYMNNVFNGRLDVGLSEKGHMQADYLFRYFKDKVSVIYSSPLKRCKLVSDKFKGVANVIVDERLKERSFGVFESLSWQEIEKKYPKEANSFMKDPFNYKPPKGESFAELEDRVGEFLHDLFEELNNDVLIVAHGGINRIIIKLLLGLAEESLLKISQDYACINQFQTDGKFVLVKLLNGQVCFDRRV